MKTLVPLFAFLVSVSSCRPPAPLADPVFTDSLLSIRGLVPQVKSLGKDSLFWTERLGKSGDAFTASSRLAGLFVQKFQLQGDMRDLLKADSIYSKLITDYKGMDAGILRSMASLQITRHRFRQADSLVLKSLALGQEKYTGTLLAFDTKFELGEYILAEHLLKECAATNEYGYFFRMGKWMHYKGLSDSAAWYLQKAADWAGTSPSLKQAAFSNLADLYLHDGKMKEAAILYKRVLSQNPVDFHSLRGWGRIALLHDQNPGLAQKIFDHTATINGLPDPWYDKIWVAEEKSDTVLARKTAEIFVQKASDPVYGAMYHKYLFELYTGVLNRPEPALSIALSEVKERPTPQTYAWLVWALHKNGKEAAAKELYDEKVSGKPLEALELFWMGKWMKENGQGYNASAFFKAAERNLYDLSPWKQQELKSFLL